MADFDLTQVPSRVAERLDAVAADAVTRGQQMFAKALEDQRSLLAALMSPATSIAAATATRAQQLAEGPPPSPPPSPPPPASSPSAEPPPATPST